MTAKSSTVTFVIQFTVTLDSLNLHESAIRSACAISKLIRTGLCPVHMVVLEEAAIANIAPDEARRILERTCERVKLRANSNGECLGGDIMDSLREASVELGAHHIEILQIRRLLVHTMESLGEEYPAEILQDYDHRMPLSRALRFLNEAIKRTKGTGNNS